jgi:hypothetical protein
MDKDKLTPEAALAAVRVLNEYFSTRDYEFADAASFAKHTVRTAMSGTIPCAFDEEV